MFEQWLAANGYDAEKLSEPQRKHLTAAWKAETAPPVAVAEVVKPAVNGNASFDEKMAAIESETTRQEAILDITQQMAQANVGNSDKLKQLRELCSAAIADQKMEVRDYRLQMLRFDRMGGPMVMTPHKEAITSEVIEAAVCMTGGLEKIEKHYSPQTLEAANKHFRGMGLQQIVLECAISHGYRGRGNFKSDMPTVWKAAMGKDEYSMQAAVTGPSTYSLPNLFGNVANKFLRVGFEAVDMAWKNIAAVSSRSDFKTATTIALTGSSVYDELPPSGEIKHGTLGETTYTNRVKTYARMIGIDRQHLINDDLGALTNVGRRIGIDAARTINYIFWGVFLNNSSFFSSGNANVITGGTSVLSSAALKLADQKFRNQTDPDGLPLGIEPAILLVPGTLSYTARELMNSSFLVGTTTANTLLPSQNIFNGAYRVVTSPYMENTALTGNSATAWYLLADPNVMPAIEIAFLNGKDTPTVETTEMEFNMLGMATRAYIDFGVSLQEYRAGVRAAGA